MTRAGRELEFQEFVAAKAGPLFKVAFFMCGNWHDAQDLVQTSLAKLYVAWNKIEQAGAVDAYARTVLLRTYLSQRRLKRSGESPTDLHLLGERLAAPAADLDLYLSLATALKTLPPRDRAVVVLRYLEGHDFATIAGHLGITESAAKSLNQRALRRLRMLLGDERDALFSAH